VRKKNNGPMGEKYKEFTPYRRSAIRVQKNEYEPGPGGEAGRRATRMEEKKRLGREQEEVYSRTLRSMKTAALE